MSLSEELRSGYELPKEIFDEYILVAPGSDYGIAMWSDIGLATNGMILANAVGDIGKIGKLLHHMHFSFAINNRVRLPFQGIWKKLYSLEALSLSENKRYCVIYTDVSASRTDEGYLAELGNRKNITPVLILVNTMLRRGNVIKRRLKYFRYVFSFDKMDCEKYGFIYHSTNYSMVPVDSKSEVTKDAFFVGVSKGRAERLAAIYTKIVETGGKADFYISGMKRDEARVDGIHYNQWIDYGQVLEKIRDSNCLIEVMDGNQNGVTLRMMEAVCYNKRLLTNNKAVMGSPFYRTGFIRVFENIEDIDVSFICDRSKVDYHYQGEFSPVHLVEHINRVEKTGGQHNTKHYAMS